MAAIDSSAFTAAGDILLGTGAGTYTALGAGSLNTVLVSAAPGVIWSKVLTANLDDEAVTNGKLSIMDAKTIKGNSLGSLGPPQDLGVGTVLTMLTTAAGWVNAITDTIENNVLDTRLMIGGGSPALEFRETDQTLPAGYWRARVASEKFQIQKNTAVAGDYSTRIDGLTIDDTGRVGLLNDDPLYLLHVGPGSDTPVVAPSLYLAINGTAAFTVRNCTANVEFAMAAGSTTVAMGAMTNHALNLQTNATNRLTIAAGGAVDIPGALTVGGALGTTWAGVTFAANWADLGSESSIAYQTAQFKKVGDLVFLRGVVVYSGSANFTTSGVKICDLDSGFRPATATVHTVSGSQLIGSTPQALEVRITTGGEVRLYGPTGNAISSLSRVKLDGIVFSTAS